MRVQRSVYPFVVFILWICIAVQSAFAGAAYDYTGSPFVACGPTLSSCPSNSTADYLVASISFPDPLGDGITVTDDFSSITAWSLSDELGYFSLSSNDFDAASELDAVQITTDGSGDIVGYYIEVSSADRPALGYDTAFIQPALVPVGGADYMDLSHGTAGEWAASSANSGVWSTEIVISPEPPSRLLSLCGAILLLTMRKKNRSSFSWAASAEARRRRSD
jgi:hypothetical protein